MGDEDQAIPEPKPDWDNNAQDTFGWLWPAHVYLFSVLFITLAMVTILALVLNFKYNRKKHFVKNIMLCAVIVLSVSRSVILLVDPYLSSGRTSIWWTFGCVLVTGLGTTSLTASLAILLYITTISTRITTKSRQQHLGRVVCGITIANVAFFITSDVITMFWKDQGAIMLTVCQITFSCWGILVSTGFGTLTCKLRRNARATFEQAKINIRMRNEGTKLRKLGVLLGTLSATSALFFVIRISEAISGWTSKKYSDSWPWWAIQTSLRTLEVINAIVLLLVFQRERGEVQEAAIRPQHTAVTESEKHTLWKTTSVKSTTDSV